MFSKAFLVSVVVLFMGLQVNAHAIVTPALGVSGNPTRNDVQRPSAAKPCGDTSLSKVGSSTPVKIGAGGVVTMTVQNFNGGVDGSRAIKTLKIDASGTGEDFQTVADSAITKNGDADPAAAGTQQITIKMPADIKCSGGAGKDLCLVSLTTDGGFGNCVVASQSGAAQRDARAIGSRAARAYLDADIGDLE